MKLQIRNIQEKDLDFCEALAQSVGWVSQDRIVFEIFLQREPEGCFLAEMDGKPTGMIIATPYSRAGYLGTLIVDPAARGQGIGGKLLMHATAFLQNRGVESVYLDGAPKAVPLYERLGFVRIGPILRFDGLIPPQFHPQISRMEPQDYPEVFLLDKEAFGEDRSYFLEKRASLWPNACLVYREKGQIKGFLTGRNYAGGVAVGPWIVTDAVGDPKCILAALGAQSGETSFHISVLESNTAAVKLLRDAGFSERPDIHQRMVYGERGTLGQSNSCYAIGALSKG